MKTLRKCRFNIPQRVKVEGLNKRNFYEYEDNWKEGYFHEWGSDYEEFETGPGNFSVAIVEDEDGNVFTPCASNVVFTQ